jgi:hypothetical protein
MTMHDTIPQPPERTATAAELADHAARTERALAGRPLPRTLHALIEQAARLVPCGLCWQCPGRACDGRDGFHLARFCRARRRGLITADEMASVLAGYEVFSGATIVRDVTP